MNLKEFMSSYEGFDWDNGKVVLVNASAKPIICSGIYKTYFDRYRNNAIRGWTHDSELMVITLK